MLLVLVHDPHSEFCTNDSEAINSALKQFLAFKKSDWPILNEKMGKLSRKKSVKPSSTLANVKWEELEDLRGKNSGLHSIHGLRSTMQKIQVNHDTISP